jgi:hypothetical protein
MEVDWRIAALIGAGLPDDAIAQELRVEQKIVRRVRRNVPEDEDLARIVAAARKRLMDKMIQGAEKALDTAVAGLDGVEVPTKGGVVTIACPPDKAIAVFRELGKASGLSNPQMVEEEQENTGKIDFTNPQERLDALRALQRNALETEQRLQSGNSDLPALPEHTEEAQCSVPSSSE